MIGSRQVYQPVQEFVVLQESKRCTELSHNALAHFGDELATSFDKYLKNVSTIPHTLSIGICGDRHDSHRQETKIRNSVRTSHVGILERTRQEHITQKLTEGKAWASYAFSSTVECLVAGSTFELDLWHTRVPEGPHSQNVASFCLLTG
jgi:hypothetical protein